MQGKTSLIAEAKDVESQIENFVKDWELIPTKFEEFLELANSAYLSLSSASVDLKREMLSTVTSNLTADGKSVSVKLESPFELLSSRPPFPSGRPRPNKDRTFSAFLGQILKAFCENRNVSSEVT